MQETDGRPTQETDGAAPRARRFLLPVALSVADCPEPLRWMA